MTAKYTQMKQAYTRTVLVTLTIILSVVSGADVMAQGNLLITPRRIVFDGKKKAQVMNIANTGKDTATYIISMVEIRMNKFGAFEEITVPDSGQNFASGYLRYNPRSVRLAPNEAQTVRIQITKPGLLQQGEYRSHIFVRAEPDERDLAKAKMKNDSMGISVQMIPIFGVSVPVIIHVGQSTAQVSISDVATERVSDTSIGLKMIVNRTGNMSVYGTIKVDYISEGGKTTEVFGMKGIGVYTPTPGRFMYIDLKKRKGIDYRSGKLHIMYLTPEEEKGLTLAETEYALQ